MTSSHETMRFHSGDAARLSAHYTDRNAKNKQKKGDQDKQVFEQ